MCFVRTISAPLPADSVQGNRARRRSRSHGFTLIEVLATLLLLGIALPAIMVGFSRASHAADLARQRSDAGGLAESKLNELVATGAWQNGATLSGTFDDHPEIQWTATVYAWGSGQGVDGTNTVQQMDVKVTWNGGAESITVSTLVYQSPNATSATGLQGGL